MLESQTTPTCTPVVSSSSLGEFHKKPDVICKITYMYTMKQHA